MIAIGRDGVRYKQTKFRCQILLVDINIGYQSMRWNLGNTGSPLRKSIGGINRSI